MRRWLAFSPRLIALTVYCLFPSRSELASSSGGIPPILRVTLERLVPCHLSSSGSCGHQWRGTPGWASPATSHPFEALVPHRHGLFGDSLVLKVVDRFSKAVHFKPPLFPSQKSDAIIPSAHVFVRRCLRVWRLARQDLACTRECNQAPANRQRSKAQLYTQDYRSLSN